jgi:thiamine pyrophosphate-dependent acetolactate synthase large subunit-like protein
LAARIRDKQVDIDGSSKSFDYEEDTRIVEEAKRFLKEHPKLLPTLSKDGEKVLEWPSEALRYLGDSYIPKDRPIQFVIAINRGTGERIL